MANGFQPQPNDFSSNSKSTHFLQASAGHMKLPMQYGTSENMSGSKSPKGCYLSGEHVVYYVDDWIPVQVNSELVLFPSKVFQHQDRPSKIGNQISANKQYLGYCTQSGMIYVYNRQTRQQCLLQGHQQRVTDMAFCGDQVSLLASASSDGHVFIWSITETSGEEDDQMTRGKILFSIQVLGEWESVHPLVCWRNQDLVVGIDKYVLTLSAEELKKNFVSSGFAFDNPMRCHVGNLTGGIKFAGVHDLEVTALTVISRRPTLIASASRDGTVRIWRDQEPVAVTRFVPYEGLPVYSVSCLSPFENDLHMILTSGGQENRELKLWVPFDTSCLVPAADIGKWKCIETVELKNSTDRRPCQLYFDRTLRDSGASLLLVGCTHDSSIYVVHVRFEAHSACMDYLSKFCVELPISNLAARSDSSGDGEEIVEIFCVHEESIHLYTLRRSQCTPPAHNGLSGPLSPTGSYRHLQELDLSDPLGFYSAESDNYCTLEMDDKAESLSSVSRASESLSSQSTSSGFGSWIEVPKLFDQLRDVGHVQTTDFVLQEQKTTGLTQLNSIATAPFSQQIPVLGLTRNDSWKGTKYSPVVSLGKLPETVAMTSFTTYTVPSLSIGHKSHEILTYDDKWNVKACKPTDFEGCNDGYPYALNALSSTIDNTNLCARNSVHSSVTDQSITGKINIALSSNFIDKKTVTMKNQKLHEMGETSELNNWNMSSEMLSLMNIERVRDKIVCSIMDTREIELPECSDWNYIHRRSTPANISLPYVLGKYAYDEQIDPFQVHGEEAVTSTAAVGSSFLGQSRKPVIFKAFETLDVCTSSVQESLCTLASMHAEFQKHISVAVEDTMCEESNRLDSCIAKHLERCLETYVDEIHLGFRKEASTRDDKQSVMHDMVLTVSKIGFPSTACENIVTEISSLGPAITRSILSHSDRMETAVVRNISQKQEIITDQLEKSIVVAAGNYIIEQLQANFWSQTLQESIGYYFQDKALPLYENLLRKVMERGETSSQENEHCYTSHIWADLTSHFISVAFMLKETLTFAKMDLRSMEEELREGLRRVLYLMHCNENYVLKRFCNDRNDREVYDDHEGTFHTVYFSILVGEGMFEEAFIRILSLGDVNAVLWLCNQVDSSNIFASNPIPVSQLVLLSLLQQLACDLGREMAQKLLWIREAATAINPNDPTLSYYIRPVLEQVYLNLQRQLIQISPGSTLVNQMKVIMHVINSLLTSCR